ACRAPTTTWSSISAPLGIWNDGRPAAKAPRQRWSCAALSAWSPPWPPGSSRSRPLTCACRMWRAGVRCGSPWPTAMRPDGLRCASAAIQPPTSRAWRLASSSRVYHPSFFANRLGTKRFYLIALVFFTLGSALCGLAWNLTALIIFRVIQGIGGATLFPLAITLLFYEFPPNERGLAAGVLSVSALMAPAVEPTLGGYLVTYANWLLIFFINVPQGRSQSFWRWCCCASVPPRVASAS